MTGSLECVQFFFNGLENTEWSHEEEEEDDDGGVVVVFLFVLHESLLFQKQDSESVSETALIYYPFCKK